MNQTEVFLARLMQVLSDRFKDHLVLKGGMHLRLLHSPRSTQDVDFILISKESKKILVKSIQEAFAKAGGILITKEHLNSKGIFLSVEEETTKIKTRVEISVWPKTELPTEPLTTAPLVSQTTLSVQLISALAVPEAFSHKIAAALERTVMRDFYDLSLFEPMGAFDPKTLAVRLLKFSVNRAKPKKMSFQEAAALLREKMKSLTEKRLEEELYPLLPPEYRAGLLPGIRASLSRIIQRLETIES